MTDRGKMMKFRVLKDFDEHKVGDIIEMPFMDARGLVNSDKVTADLGDQEGKEDASTKR